MGRLRGSAAPRTSSNSNGAMRTLEKKHCKKKFPERMWSSHSAGKQNLAVISSTEPHPENRAALPVKTRSGLNLEAGYQSNVSLLVIASWIRNVIMNVFDEIAVGSVEYSMTLLLVNLGESIGAQSHDNVTMLFSDLVGFTAICATATPMEVISLLQSLYTRFDALCGHLDVYKVIRVLAVRVSFTAIKRIPSLLIAKTLVCLLTSHWTMGSGR